MGEGRLPLVWPRPQSVSVQGVDQKPGFWCSTNKKLLAVERFSEANGILWQEKPGFLSPW